MRGTTRDPRRVGQIEAAGAEAVVGDPDRIATLAAALEHVGVACVLLGSAAGQARELEALHGSRLEMLLSRMLDSTVRGIVWEAAGGVDPDLLQAGAQRVRAFCEDSRIPYAMLEADPSDHDAWLAAAIGAVERVLQRS